MYPAVYARYACLVALNACYWVRRSFHFGLRKANCQLVKLIIKWLWCYLVGRLLVIVACYVRVWGIVVMVCMVDQAAVDPIELGV